MTADNPYGNYSTSIDGSAKYHAAIVPDTEFASVSRGIYVGGAGDMSVRSLDGVVVTYKNLPAGYVLPVFADMVVAAGTTATNLVAMW